MSERHGESVSVWLDQNIKPSRILLNEDFRKDVCIVGGVIAGLTTT
jgi:hypothetical protein